MTETSAPWNGTTVGDASSAPYDAPTEWAKLWRSISGAQAITTDLGGVFNDDLNELAVSGTVTSVDVATGRALVYGTWYESDAIVTVAIPTPAASTRIDRIVLRKDWTLQTVRVTRIPGVEGGAAPALVQIAGTTWDMPLAQASITTGGVITVTDDRDFIRAGGPTVDIQVFTATGTWTKKEGAKLVRAILFGGGGGGGGGNGGAAASERGGGGSGGGGSISVVDYDPSILGATEAVAVGAGGAAGPGGSSGQGTDGGLGGTTSFGTAPFQSAYGGGGGGGTTAASGGAGGGGGGTGAAGVSAVTITPGAGGAPLGAAVGVNAMGGSGAGGVAPPGVGTYSEYGGAGGAGATSNGTVGQAGGSSLRGGPSGGTGGGVTTGNAESAGGAGGAAGNIVTGGGGAGGAVNGGAGGNGTSRSGSGRAGDGGGGGGSQDSGTGGAAGTSGIPASGGGGGGGGTTVGGAGAAGARGEAIIITFF